MASSPSTDRIGVFGQDGIFPLVLDSELRNVLQLLFRARDEKVLASIRDRLIQGHLKQAYGKIDETIARPLDSGPESQFLQHFEKGYISLAEGAKLLRFSRTTFWRFRIRHSINVITGRRVSVADLQKGLEAERMRENGAGSKRRGKQRNSRAVDVGPNVP